MRILIDDGMQIEVGTGIGKYSLYLYNELKKITTIDYVDLFQFDKKGRSKSTGRLKYLSYINSKRFQKKCREYDVVHFTNYAMPFFKNKNVKYVVTIHDLAAFLHPESLPYTYRLYSQMIIRLSMNRADVVLTVSEAVKKEISQKWPRLAYKVYVVYPGLYSEFENEVIAPKYDTPILKNIEKGKFFLFSGTIERRKNLSIVIEAFIKMKKANKNNDYKLVLAGRPGFGYEIYKEMIRSADCKEDILVTGYVSSKDLLKLYHETAAYIFPSVYEGFGSTQLECMVNHVPLILSDIPTNREVSGEYGLFFRLGDVKGLEARMEEIISNDYDKDAKNKLADRICSCYSWHNLILSYLDAYNLNF